MPPEIEVEEKVEKSKLTINYVVGEDYSSKGKLHQVNARVGQKGQRRNYSSNAFDAFRKVAADIPEAGPAASPCTSCTQSCAGCVFSRSVGSSVAQKNGSEGSKTAPMSGNGSIHVASIQQTGSQHIQYNGQTTVDQVETFSSDSAQPDRKDFDRHTQIERKETGPGTHNFSNPAGDNRTPETTSSFTTHEPAATLSSGGFASEATTVEPRPSGFSAEFDQSPSMDPNKRSQPHVVSTANQIETDPSQPAAAASTPQTTQTNPTVDSGKLNDLQPAGGQTSKPEPEIEGAPQGHRHRGGLLGVCPFLAWKAQEAINSVTFLINENLVAKAEVGDGLTAGLARGVVAVTRVARGVVGVTKVGEKIVDLLNKIAERDFHVTNTDDGRVQNNNQNEANSKVENTETREQKPSQQEKVQLEDLKNSSKPNNEVQTGSNTGLGTSEKQTTPGTLVSGSKAWQPTGDVSSVHSSPQGSAWSNANNVRIGSSSESWASASNNPESRIEGKGSATLGVYIGGVLRKAETRAVTHTASNKPKTVNTTSHSLHQHDHSGNRVNSVNGTGGIRNAEGTFLSINSKGTGQNGSGSETSRRFPLINNSDNTSQGNLHRDVHVDIGRQSITTQFRTAGSANKAFNLDAGFKSDHVHSVGAGRSEPRVNLDVPATAFTVNQNNIETSSSGQGTAPQASGGTRLEVEIKSLGQPDDRIRSNKFYQVVISRTDQRTGQQSLWSQGSKPNNQVLRRSSTTSSDLATVSTKAVSVVGRIQQTLQRTVISIKERVGNLAAVTRLNLLSNRGRSFIKNSFEKIKTNILRLSIPKLANIDPRRLSRVQLGSKIERKTFIKLGQKNLAFVSSRKLPNRALLRKINIIANRILARKLRNQVISKIVFSPKISTRSALNRLASIRLAKARLALVRNIKTMNLRNSVVSQRKVNIRQATKGRAIMRLAKAGFEELRRKLRSSAKFTHRPKRDVSRNLRSDSRRARSNNTSRLIMRRASMSLTLSRHSREVRNGLKPKGFRLQTSVAEPIYRLLRYITANGSRVMVEAIGREIISSLINCFRAIKIPNLGQAGYQKLSGATQLRSNNVFASRMHQLLFQLVVASYQLNAASILSEKLRKLAQETPSFLIKFLKLLAKALEQKLGKDIKEVPFEEILKAMESMESQSQFADMLEEDTFSSVNSGQLSRKGLRFTRAQKVKISTPKSTLNLEQVEVT